MPFYEYRCRQCGHLTTFLEKLNAERTHPCEKCGSTDTGKIFSAFAVKAGKSSSSMSSCPTGTCPLS